MYTKELAILACIYLISPCIESAKSAQVWNFNSSGALSTPHDDGDESWPQYASNIGIMDMGTCDDSNTCIDLTISDNEWIIEQTSIQNMKDFDQLSELWASFFVEYPNPNSSTTQCTISWKFDTQSTYQIVEAVERWNKVLFPIDHKATALQIKLETQGLTASDSDGCIWDGRLYKYWQDGQCEVDGDECIYIIGMDDGNAADYVQEWHQQGCYQSYPVYVRESHGVKENLYNDDMGWYVTDQYSHELGRCSKKADIFACGGHPNGFFDERTLQFDSDGDRYKRKLIVECSEIDLFPAPALPENTSSICVQLEILPAQKTWVIGNYKFDRNQNDTYYATFETSEDYSKNGKPIYVYDETAIHYDGYMYYVTYDDDRWVISFDSIRLEGIYEFAAIFCNEENLFDCTQNKWSVNGTTIDRIKVTAGECGVNGLEWEHVDDVDEQKKWVLPLIICGCIGGVALLLLGMCCWKRQAKKGQHGFKGNDERV